MIDSVFSPLLEIPFPDDAPLIPAAEITRGLDAVEAPVSEIMARLQRDAAEVLLRKAGPFLADRNLAGIQSLTWNLGVTLQSPIYSVWSLGFELGSGHMLREMKTALPKGRFATVQEDIAALLSATPATITNTPAQAAVARRALTLAGNFSGDQLTAIKGHLQAAIVPVDGKLLSRPELLQKIEGTLSVGKTRAEMIARTELTNAYNSGRVQTALQSSLVTHFRFLAISDARTTPICRSRNGMLIPVADRGAIAANSPSLHVRCRSVLSPVMAGLNPAHAQWANDPGRDYQSRNNLVPLPKGWGPRELPGGAVVSAPALPLTPVDKLKEIKKLSSPTLETLTKRGATATELFLDPAEVRAKMAGFASEYKAASKAITSKLKKAEATALNNKLNDIRARFDAYKAETFQPIKNALRETGLSLDDSTKAWRKVRKENLEDPDYFATVKDSFTEVNSITRGKINLDRIRIYNENNFREFATSAENGGSISLSSQSTRKTIYHELGHILEFSNPELKDAANDFVVSRATGAPKSLNKITKSNLYDPKEMAYPGKFTHPYVGSVNSEGWTEVWSMGLQDFSDPKNMAELFYADPEHFNLIMGGLTL